MTTSFQNPRAAADYVSRMPVRAPLAFLKKLPGYEPTPLQSMPDLARELGVGAVFAKVESTRLGLPSYKILGAVWAVWRTLIDRLGREPEAFATLEELRPLASAAIKGSLVAASEGNFGRAVARVGKWLGLKVRIFVPESTSLARQTAIVTEGAECVAAAGDYDAALKAALNSVGPDDVLVQDVSQSGHETMAARVTEGFGALFFEIDDELALTAEAPMDAVFLPVGVGSLASAAVRHYRRPGLRTPPRLVGVESEAAPRARLSVAQNQIVELESVPRSIMVGLLGRKVSPAAFPLLRDGMDAFLSVSDADCLDAVRSLATEGIVAGAAGAAALTGLMQMRLKEPKLATSLRIDSRARVLVLVTEGATDPDWWRRTVGSQRGRQ